MLLQGMLELNISNRPLAAKVPALGVEEKDQKSSANLCGFLDFFLFFTAAILVSQTSDLTCFMGFSLKLRVCLCLHTESTNNL